MLRFAEVNVSGSRTLAGMAGGLWLAHVAVVVRFGVAAPGPTLSDVFQFALGLVLIYALLRAGNDADGMARSFWRLTMAAYGLLVVGQVMSIYIDLTGSPTVSWIANILYCFWFAPLAMAIFLDPENPLGQLDTLKILDFVQAMLVCGAAYIYFFYLPKADSPEELAHSVWTPYFVGYTAVSVSFLLRAAVTTSRDVRSLFGRMGAFLVVSGCVDALYYYGPGRGLRTGAWFDLLWSALLVAPTLLAITWKQAEPAEPGFEPPKRERRIFSEIFYLIYPMLVLLMSLYIARARLGLASAIVFLSFVCSSARLLVTQQRLLRTKDTLRREAARDGLTGLWNHKAILEILDRELLRAERDATPVGVIMADVDHFKAINDERGHAAGDSVLRILATAMAAVVRPYDSVGRYGGEEFLIVAPNCNLAETWELAERVRAHVAACNINAAGSKVHVSLSLGIATGNSASDAQKLLRAADAALYQAKAAGRNQVAPALGRAASASPASTPAPGRDFWL